MSASPRSKKRNPRRPFGVRYGVLLFELIAPLLALQGLAVLFRARGPLRSASGDEDSLAIAVLGLAAIASVAIVVVHALGSAPSVGAAANAIAGGAAALGLLHARRRRVGRTHVSDLNTLGHEVLERIGPRILRARLGAPGMVGGIEWPKGTSLVFERLGWLSSAVPTTPLRLCSWLVAADEPVAFDARGRVLRATFAEATRIGRLPRAGLEVRGPELWATAVEHVSPTRLRGIRLARTHTIRGVSIPAGSTLHAADTVVEATLAGPTTVHGHPLPAGSRLILPPRRLATAPIEVELPKEAAADYRELARSGTIRISRDGRTLL